MASFRITKKAKSDLLSIGRYTAEKWGIHQRNSYLKQLDQCFAQISEAPGIGVACDYIAHGYRKFPQGSHLIFYKLGAEGIVEIIRVLYKSMDVDSKF